MNGKTSKGIIAGAFAGMVGVSQVDAQDETAAAGNGGTAEASANGGAVAVGDVNSGGNTGSVIGVGDTWGSVAVDGGASANSTTLDITANGGTAIADASGGDYNIAFLDEFFFGGDNGGGNNGDDDDNGFLS